MNKKTNLVPQFSWKMKGILLLVHPVCHYTCSVTCAPIHTNNIARNDIPPLLVYKIRALVWYIVHIVVEKAVGRPKKHHSLSQTDKSTNSEFISLYLNSTVLQPNCNDVY
jgi:hypothetical protein